MNTKWKIVGRSIAFYQGAGRVLFSIRRVWFTPNGVSGAETKCVFRHELKRYGVEA